MFGLSGCLSVVAKIVAIISCDSLLGHHRGTAESRVGVANMSRRSPPLPELYLAKEKVGSALLRRIHAHAEADTIAALCCGSGSSWGSVSHSRAPPASLLAEHGSTALPPPHTQPIQEGFEMLTFPNLRPAADSRLLTR